MKKNLFLSEGSTSLGLLREPNLNIQPEGNVYQIGTGIDHIEQEFKDLVKEKLAHLNVQDRQIFETLLYGFRDIFSTEQSVLSSTSAVIQKIETGYSVPNKQSPFKNHML